MNFCLRLLWAVIVQLLFATITSALPQAQTENEANNTTTERSGVTKPKVVIISMFDSEEEAWWGIPEFDIQATKVPVVGLSVQFPNVLCTEDGNVCQVTCAMGEINAASSLTAFVLSPKFDLTTTYFLISGVAGIRPESGTTGSVTFAKYALQIALQYEFDAREIPANFTTGYVPQGADAPLQYPVDIYGTEVFEVNEALRSRAVAFARQATLNDTEDAQAFRINYATSKTNETTNKYAKAVEGPAIYECDTATSDTWYSGSLLSDSFTKYANTLTNGSGNLCTSQQEDNASLEVLLRGAVANLTDFSRIIIMRTASDFESPYPGLDPVAALLDVDQGGYAPAVTNIYRAGVKVVEGIINEWNETYAAGIEPTNYIGDILGSLGGTPDFGPNSSPVKEVSSKKRRQRRNGRGK